MCNTVFPRAIRGHKNGDGYKQKLYLGKRPYANAITTTQRYSIVVSERFFDDLTRPVSHCIDATYFHGFGIRRRNWLPRRQVVLKDLRIRRLTPRECWRLMGFSDSDFEKARTALIRRFYRGRDRADSQLYKQAGNSVVVNVLVAILRELRSSMPELFRDMKVGSFFSGIGAFEKALSELPEQGETTTGGLDM